MMQSDAIRAELIGDQVARAYGVTAQGPNCVLTLARTLLDTGFHPAAVLEVYGADGYLVQRLRLSDAEKVLRK